MAIISHLGTHNVFKYFEEICNIPHGSGNTAYITQYLVDFAKEHGITHRRDEIGNVIMRKPATPGYEEVPGIVLQGHIDMVAVQTPDSKKDMLTEGLDLEINGDFISAKKTTLGADNGIAVAYAMAVMTATDLEHPEIEAILTVDEETGMFGAEALDMSDIKGKRFLNIDSEEEGFFLTSCAGGARVRGYLPMNMNSISGTKLSVCVKGLLGGHSGMEIITQRANAMVLLARALRSAYATAPLYLQSMTGGVAENAIPREALAYVVCAEGDVEAVVARLREVESDLQVEYKTIDPDVKIDIIQEDTDFHGTYTRECTKKFLDMVLALPVGVQSMSADMEGLVETSLNLGIVSTDEAQAAVQYAVRSSVASAKEALIQKMSAIFDLAGARCDIGGNYPGWAYNPYSEVREKMIRVYTEKYGKAPAIQAIHAGLECGLFIDKMPDLDCISFGPNMYDVHTTNEKLSISSTITVWEFLIAVLQDKQ
ncbi:MAG: aminoacyl-histidine dipeptidase [Lachnospiraceae bacterium]